jgi:hypothetical protein
MEISLSLSRKFVVFPHYLFKVIAGIAGNLSWKTLMPYVTNLHKIEIMKWPETTGMAHQFSR